MGDFNLDGHLDLFKTNFVDDTCVLYQNDGKAQFQDVTRTSRIGIESSFICWGTGIVDLDNDGYPDIFVVTGTVYPEVAKQLPQYPAKSPRLLFQESGRWHI